MLYFYFFAFITFFTLTEFSKTLKKIKWVTFVYFSSFLILLGGIRWETGTDWLPYFNYFTKNIKYSDFMSYSAFEIGFKWLNYLVKLVTPNYTLFLLLQSSFIILCKIKRIRIDSIYPLFSLLIYFSSFLGDIFFVRQSIAISICVLWGIRYIKDRNFIYFFFTILLAMIFHSSAIVFFFAYFMYKDIRFKSLNLIVIISIIFGTTGILFFMIQFLMQKIPLGNFILQRLLAYGGEDLTFSLRKVLKILDRLFIVVINLLVFNKLKNNKNYRFYLNLYYVNISIFFLFVGSMEVFIRFSMFYKFSEVLLVPIILKNLRGQYLKLSIYFLFVLYYLFKLYNVLGGYWDLFVPFGSILYPVIGRVL